MTKWPEYYDGSWLILERSQNWWREVRLRQDAHAGNAVLRVNDDSPPLSRGWSLHGPLGRLLGGVLPALMR
ncbi:hypothetical protein [Streptomyces synnematoformans]